MMQVFFSFSHIQLIGSFYYSIHSIAGLAKLFKRHIGISGYW
jgi:hypothetical protein